MLEIELSSLCTFCDYEFSYGFTETGVLDRLYSLIGDSLKPLYSLNSGDLACEIGDLDRNIEAIWPNLSGDFITGLNGC